MTITPKFSVSVFSKKKTWIIVVLLSLIYLSTLVLFFVDGTIGSSREYPVSFEPVNIDLTAEPYAIINPSFELVDPLFFGWEPVIWDGVAEIIATSSTSRTGLYCAQLSSGSLTSSALISNSSSKISVISGETYLTSVWTKTGNVSSGSGALLCIAWFDSNGSYVSTSFGSSISNASDWTKIFVSDVAPTGAVSAKLELHFNGVGYVWYDDVSFSKSLRNYSSSTWSSNRLGLDGAQISANDTSLFLEGTFAYPTDERVTYNTALSLDTSEYSFITLEYQTSAKNCSGLLIVLNYADGTEVITYGTAVTDECTEVYIDTRKTPAYLYYLGADRQTVPGKQLESLDFILNDIPDNVSSGTFSVQVKNVIFHRFVTYDLLLLVESIVLLTFLIILGAKSNELIMGKPLNVILLIFGATLCLVGAATSILFPVFPSVGTLSFDMYLLLQLIGVLIILVASFTQSKIPNIIPKRLDGNISNIVIISWILGLILIPSLGLVIRANNALTLPLFDDELSYGLNAWGLTQGSLIGLNLAEFAPEAQALIDTGHFTVQSWPTSLQVPFTSTSLYPDFTLVGPNFSHPSLAAIICAPFVYLFGFDAFTIRLPFLFFNVATALLIFYVAARKGNFLAGLIGSSFFSFVPYITHYGAEAYLDNILGFFFMVSVFFVLKHYENKRSKFNRDAYLAVIFGALCALIKIQGAFVSIFVFMALYLAGSEKRLITRNILLYISIVMIFPITGLLISSNAFLLSLQGILSITSSYNTGQLPSTLTGAFSIFELMRYWSVAISILCGVHLFAENISEKKILILGTFSWILYGLFFSYKEWYLMSFFAIGAVILGYVFSSVVTNNKHVSRIFLLSFLLIPNFEKIGSSFLQTIGFLSPLIFFSFLSFYLERNDQNYNNKMKILLSSISIFYIIVSFGLMMLSSWNYMYWA